MRLVIFLGSLVALILVSRWYSIEPEGQSDPATTTGLASLTGDLAEPVSTPAVAPPVFGHRAIKAIAPVNKIGSHSPSGGVLTGIAPAAALASADALKRTDALKRADGFTSADAITSEMRDNANNVRVLVRAEYEIPRAAAELLMQLKTDVLLEMEWVDSDDSAAAFLQVTTDTKTQQSVCRFLSSLYPGKESFGQMVADDRSAAVPTYAQPLNRFAAHELPAGVESDRDSADR